MEVLKVSSKSNPNSVAGALAGVLREKGSAEIQAIGAGALNQAVNRMGTPEDIADAVYFFASNKSAYITGSVLEVSGGYHLGTPQYSDFVGKSRQS